MLEILVSVHLSRGQGIWRALELEQLVLDHAAESQRVRLRFSLHGTNHSGSAWRKGFARSGDSDQGICHHAGRAKRPSLA